MNKEKERQLAELLSELEPGFLPFDIFLQVTRLVTTSIIEFVPVRMNNGIAEVLLLDRGPDDVLWPNELHTPGTVIRPTDNEGEIDDTHMFGAFRRVIDDELKGTELSAPHYVGGLIHKSKRGTENSQIYWIEVLGEPKIGRFYPADRLPSNLIESQRKFIGQAVKNYLSSKTG